LESEVRELKDLLDEKDEKIDMLSKMHGHRPPSIRSSASPRSPVEMKRDESPPAKHDVFRVQATPLLLGVENSDSYFMGSSSGRAFIGKLIMSVIAIQDIPNMVVRNIQAEDPRKWEAMWGLQPGSISSHSRFLSFGIKTTIAVVKSPTSTVLRQMCEHLFPRMGAALSCPP
jgi:hypothetical protein